jgi:hypothetical protein
MSEDRVCCPCGIPTHNGEGYCPNCEPPPDPPEPRPMHVGWIPNEHRTGP